MTETQKTRHIAEWLNADHSTDDEGSDFEYARCEVKGVDAAINHAEQNCIYNWGWCVIEQFYDPNHYGPKEGGWADVREYTAEDGWVSRTQT